MSKPTKRVTPEGLCVLLALARFRNLTVKQMVRLGVSKAKSEAVIRNEVFPRLRDGKPPFTWQSSKVMMQPYIHSMSEHGARYLENVCKYDEGSVPFTKRAPDFSPVFIPHRLAQIDFHVEFALWAHSWGAQGYATIEEQDFFVTGSQIGGDFVSATELILPDGVGKIKPDGVFGANINGHDALYIVEIHRTTDTRRVTAQLLKYAKALETGAFSYKYQVPVAPYICSVHMKPAALAGAKKAILQHPNAKQILGNFVFNFGSQISKSFTDGWHFADERPINLFPLPQQPNTDPFLSA